METEKRLSDIGRRLHHDFITDYGDSTCYCERPGSGNWIACGYCRHPGNPENLKDYPLAWEGVTLKDMYAINPYEEADPDGLTSDTPGAKMDQGKPKCSQILGMFARALWEVSKVGTFGADKYSMGGWKHVEDGIHRYANARARHGLLRAMGETNDPDSGLLHLAHEAWNALAVLELYLRENPQDKVTR